MMPLNDARKRKLVSYNSVDDNEHWSNLIIVLYRTVF